MQTGSFTFSQQPIAIAPTRKPSKQRHAAEPPHGVSNALANLMWDKRVVRGNTHAVQSVPSGTSTEAIEKTPSPPPKKLREKNIPSPIPGPVEGRQHIEIQTEVYLEELVGAVAESTVDTQTDSMMDRPPSPPFVPAKEGRDMETQIEEGDLFDFDVEVEPILEVLVGQTLEQAMLEVLQEEELQALRRQQAAHEAQRRAELVEVQRLEAAEHRRIEEKERRKAQERERCRREEEARAKLSALQFGKQVWRDVEARVTTRLENEGWFHDSVLREVEAHFLPSLLIAMDEHLERRRHAETLAQELVAAAAARCFGPWTPG